MLAPAQPLPSESDWDAALDRTYTAGFDLEHEGDRLHPEASATPDQRRRTMAEYWRTRRARVEAMRMRVDRDLVGAKDNPVGMVLQCLEALSR